MSVTWAPRERIAEKAAWPGVSRKVMRLPEGRLTKEYVKYTGIKLTSC